MLSVGEQPHVLSLLKAARVKNYPAGAEVYNETDCRLEIRTVEAFNYGKWSGFFETLSTTTAQSLLAL